MFSHFPESTQLNDVIFKGFFDIEKSNVNVRVGIFYVFLPLFSVFTWILCYFYIYYIT